MGTLRDLQRAHAEWLKHNFPNQTPHQALLGVTEEVGELAHAHLKMEQGIRGDAVTHRADAADAIGDIIIYLASYCNTNDYDLEECVNEAWRGVSQRDWQAAPADGKAGEFTVSAPTCTCEPFSDGPFVNPDCAVHGKLKLGGFKTITPDT